LTLAIELALHYEQLRKQEEQDLNALLRAIQKNEIYDPMIALDIKQNIISSHMKALILEQKVMFTYIKWLAATGKLIQTPFRNYFKA